MYPLAVAQTRFDRVAKCVPEIQQSARAGFFLVSAYYLRLVLTRTINGGRQDFLITTKQRFHVLLEPDNKRFIAYQSVLDHLGYAGGELAIRQRVQCLGVDDYALRLMKRPDHVLAQRVINPRLSTHGGVDLRQQRRRYLDKGHTALITGGSKSHHIAHHASS